MDGKHGMDGEHGVLACNILLIRHGATAGNLMGRYNGRTDEPLLPSSSLELLKKQGEGVFPLPDRVYTSPLRRCRETAKILFPEREAEIVEEFAECDFGEFEGKTYAELNGNADYQAFIDSGGELPFPGGESRAQVEERVVRGVERILEEYARLPNGTETRPNRDGKRPSGNEVRPNGDRTNAPLLALVVHGGTILSILHHYCKDKPFSRHLQCGEGLQVKLQVTE